jgi:hypothetical protein
MPLIPALGKLRKKDHEFQDNLGYVARPCLKTQKQINKIISLSNYIEQCFPRREMHTTWGTTDNFR